MLIIQSYVPFFVNPTFDETLSSSCEEPQNNLTLSKIYSSTSGGRRKVWRQLDENCIKSAGDARDIGVVPV